MKWRTDKPTADIIVAKLTGKFTCSEEGRYALLYRGDKPYEHYEEDYEEVPYSAIEKWADLEEDEAVTKYNDLEWEIDQYIRRHWNGDECVFYWPELAKLARHFARWGAEHLKK